MGLSVGEQTLVSPVSIIKRSKRQVISFMALLEGKTCRQSLDAAA
jgi:hypothetical protein